MLLPALRSRTFPSLFDDVDNLFGDVWSRWPSIQHKTISSRFSSYEDEKGYVMQVTLPEGTTSEDIKAEIKEGILTLTIEKPEVAPEKVAIEEVK